MMDYQLDQVEGPQRHPAAGARLTEPPKAAYRLSAKHYGVKAPTRGPLISSAALCARPLTAASFACLACSRGSRLETLQLQYPRHRLVALAVRPVNAGEQQWGAHGV